MHIIVRFHKIFDKLNCSMAFSKPNIVVPSFWHDCVFIKCTCSSYVGIHNFTDLRCGVMLKTKKSHFLMNIHIMSLGTKFKGPFKVHYKLHTCRAHVSQESKCFTFYLLIIDSSTV